MARTNAIACRSGAAPARLVGTQVEFNKIDADTVKPDHLTNGVNGGYSMHPLRSRLKGGAEEAGLN